MCSGVAFNNPELQIDDGLSRRRIRYATRRNGFQPKFPTMPIARNEVTTGHERRNSNGNERFTSSLLLCRWWPIGEREVAAAGDGKNWTVQAASFLARSHAVAQFFPL